MRLIGHIIVLIVCFAIGSQFWLVYKERFWSDSQNVSSESKKPGYSTRRSYNVTEGDKLIYRPPKNATDLRVIVYPVFENSEEEQLSKLTDATEMFTYITELYSGGQSESIEVLTELNQYNHPPSNELIDPFWIHSKNRLGSSRSFTVELDPKNNEVILQFTSQLFRRFIVRAYYQQRQSLKRHEQLWQRSSNKRKRDLLVFYPFNEDQLKTYERQNMYHSAWRSIAPLSIGDKEPRPVTLQEYNDRDKLVPSEGSGFDLNVVYLPKNNKYTFAVTKESELVMTVDHLDEEFGSIQMRLLHKLLNGSVNEKIIEIQSNVLQMNMGSGSYEVSFNQPAAIMVEANSNINLPDTKTKFYNLRSADTINYELVKAEPYNQKYRLLMRRVGEEPVTKIMLEYISETGLVDQEIIDLEFNQGIYTSFLSDPIQGLRSISEMKEKMITVTDSTQYLRATVLEGDILISAYNGFDELPSIKTVQNNRTESLQDAWFLLKAKEDFLLSSRGQIKYHLNIDKFKISKNKTISAFERLIPDNSNRFIELYHKNQVTEHSGNSAFSFSLMPAGNSTVMFNDKRVSASRVLNPRLLVNNTQQSLQDVVIQLGDLKVDLALPVGYSEHQLPSVNSLKDKALTLPKDKSLFFYSNYTKPNDSRIVKRKLYRLNGQLRHGFHKQNSNEQGFSIFLVANNNSAKQVTIQITQDGNPIKLSTGFKRVVKFMGHDPELTNAVLPFGDCKDSCFIYATQYLNLPAGTPSGQYELLLTMQGNEDAYIGLTRTLYDQDKTSVVFADER